MTPLTLVIWVLVLTVIFGAVILLLRKAPFLDAEIKSFGSYALIVIYVILLIVLLLEAFGLLGGASGVMNRPIGR